MSGEKLETVTSQGADAALVANSGEKLAQIIRHRYLAECYGPDGEMKWSDIYYNLTTTAGLNKYLEATLTVGGSSPTWYVALITGPILSSALEAADTMASHSGWSENTTYSNATRPQWQGGTVANGSVDNSGSKAVFNINGSATISGCFMVNNATKGGTTGTLLGEGLFSGGDRAVQSGDTLNVTVTCTQT